MSMMRRVLMVMGALWLNAGAALAQADGADVRIQRVEVVTTPAGPAVLLKAGNRAIPVFIDVTVAQSIHSALGGARTPRPLTHDLMHSVLSAFAGRVTHVRITLKESTFHAELSVALGETTRVFDSRASDAIALATHFKAPIEVPRELLEKQGQAVPVPGEQAL
jgi:bifunctional DNase/RNase